MSPHIVDRAQALLAASLPAWRVAGTVDRAADGAIAVTAGAIHIRVVPAAPDVPFRWMVTIGDRTRGATSILSLLRAVRAAVDPSYGPMRLRIATPHAERS